MIMFYRSLPNPNSAFAASSSFAALWPASLDTEELGVERIASASVCFPNTLLKCTWVDDSD